MQQSIYESAWTQLKKNPNTPVVLAAHPAHHKRIYKAIIKRKNEDTVFHFEMSELKNRTKLSHKTEGSALTITLHISAKYDLMELFT